MSDGSVESEGMPGSVGRVGRATGRERERGGRAESMSLDQRTEDDMNDDGRV